MIINSTSQNFERGSKQDLLFRYNGLDCCITLEVFQKMKEELDQQSWNTYQFELSQIPLALQMTFRGVRINLEERDKQIAELEILQKKVDNQLNALAQARASRDLNPNSNKQLKDFFYDTLKLPIQYRYDAKRKERVATCNREALEKLDDYWSARSFTRHILASRKLGKIISVLQTAVDPDGRLRAAFNPSGTDTGRWSSSENPFRSATNLQNITPKLRKIFISDKNFKMGNGDLEQSESRFVGAYAYAQTGISKYLDACESGDLHTFVAQQLWPNISSREEADQSFYLHFSFRDMAKRGGHGCLTEDHEILTPNGWVPITDKPSTIMTWSKDKSCFAEVSHWEDKLWTGSLIHINGNSLSTTITSDHRVVYCTDEREIFKECPANNIPTSARIPTGFGFTGGTIGPSPQMARIIAAFQSDGHQQSKNRITFNFKKERKKIRLIKLAANAGLQFTASESEQLTLIISSLPKQIDSSFLQWPLESLQAFLDEYPHWDGHINNSYTTIFSANRKQLEWLQTLYRLIGHGGNIQKQQTSGFGSTIYRLQVNNRRFAQYNRCKTVKQEVKDVRVLCPTVPSSFFYIRRKEKISVTGNTNYLGTARTMAMHLKLPTKVLEEFQELYFSEFPEIQQWHQAIATELQSEFSLTTLFGRRRNFWGRATDTETLRQAIAFLPQSASVDYLDSAALRITSDPDLKMVQPLLQGHDALTFQFPETVEEPAILEKIKAHVEQPFYVRDRAIKIPFDLSVGWNWGKYHKCDFDNPDPKKRCKPNCDKFNFDGLAEPSLQRTRIFIPDENPNRLFGVPGRTKSMESLGSLQLYRRSA